MSESKREAAHTPEFCWLVELFEGDGTGNSAGLYHTGFVDIGGSSRTTKSPHEAKRYATHAEAAHVAVRLGTTLTGTWRAVEHSFSSATDMAAEVERLREEHEGPDSWEANAKHLLARCPYTVRQCPGGGPEDIKSSLVVTFMGMQQQLREMERLREEVADKQARIDALMLEFCPDEMVRQAVRTAIDVLREVE